MGGSQRLGSQRFINDIALCKVLADSCQQHLNPALHRLRQLLRQQHHPVGQQSHDAHTVKGKRAVRCGRFPAAFLHIIHAHRHRFHSAARYAYAIIYRHRLTVFNAPEDAILGSGMKTPVLITQHYPGIAVCYGQVGQIGRLQHIHLIDIRTRPLFQNSRIYFQNPWTPPWQTPSSEHYPDSRWVIHRKPFQHNASLGVPHNLLLPNDRRADIYLHIKFHRPSLGRTVCKNQRHRLQHLYVAYRLLDIGILTKGTVLTAHHIKGCRHFFADYRIFLRQFRITVQQPDIMFQRGHCFIADLFAVMQMLCITKR